MTDRNHEGEEILPEYECRDCGEVFFWNYNDDVECPNCYSSDCVNINED